MRLLGHPVRSEITAGVDGDIDALAALDPAVGVRPDEPARGARKVGLVEPRVAGHPRHEDNQVGPDLAALGLDAVGFESEQLVAQVLLDAAPVHLRQKVLHRPLAQALAGLVHRREEDELHPLPSPHLAQVCIQAEQELEHRPAAHRRRLERIAGKSEGDGAVRRRRDPVAHLLGCGDALAGRHGVLDSG